MLNEFGIIVLSYMMMTFTSFVLDRETSFIMGYVFVALVGVILVLNITIMLKGNLGKYFLKERKK